VVALAVVAEFTDSAYAVLSVPLVILVLHQTPAGLGLLEGALSAGMVIGSGVVRHIPRNILISTRWWTVGFFCALYAILTTVPSLSWMIPIQGAAGVTLAIFQVESQTRLQALVDGDVLGTLLMWQEGLSRGGAKSLGSIGVALLAVQAGIPGAFVLFGILGALVSLWPALGLRRLDCQAQNLST
jgi:preprotein translocase subunit SecG